MDLFIKSLWNEKGLVRAYFIHTHKHLHNKKRQCWFWNSVSWNTNCDWGTKPYCFFSKLVVNLKLKIKMCICHFYIMTGCWCELHLWKCWVKVVVWIVLSWGSPSYNPFKWSRWLKWTIFSVPDMTAKQLLF